MTAKILSLNAWKADHPPQQIPQPFQWWRRCGGKADPVIIAQADHDGVMLHTGPNAFCGMSMETFLRDYEPHDGPRASWWKPSMGRRSAYWRDYA
jgi:hypothetical protein